MSDPRLINWVKDAFQDLINFLETNKIEYVIVGGILVNIYGIPRTTQGIAVIIFIEGDLIVLHAMVKKFLDAGFVPFNSIENTILLIKEGANISFYDKEETIRFDIKFAIPTKRSLLNQLAFKDRLRKKILGIECWIQSPECFILSKLSYGGYQDYRDALGALINLEKTLDLHQMELIAKDFRTKSLLKGIMQKKSPEDVFKD